MGRNSLSATQLAHKLIASLKPMADMLPPNYRRIIDKYSEYVLKHRVVIHNLTDQLPILAALIVIQMERDDKYSHEFNELYRQIEELRREIEQTTSAE
ncbi:MAG: hypothetical protein ACM3Y8_06615 [Byssovorax cruenta]|jgi:hypothetical protein